MLDFSGSRQQMLYRVDKSRNITLNANETVTTLSQELCHHLQQNFQHRQTRKYNREMTRKTQHLLQYLITEIANVNSQRHLPRSTFY